MNNKKEIEKQQHTFISGAELTPGTTNKRPSLYTRRFTKTKHLSPRLWLRRLAIFLLFVLLPALFWWSSNRGQAAEHLDDPGPYAPGWRTVTVTRPNASTFSALIYYPATSATQNAPLDSSGAPYAAISFGHGFLQQPDQYAGTLAHLASWGYLVIASASETGLFPNHQNFANDLSYSLDYLETENGSAPSWLYQAVDTSAFGMSGHSMGGGASILATAADVRVKALANLAAAETNPSATAQMSNITIPVSLISGSDDTVVPVASNGQVMYDNTAAPRQLPIIQGGYHCGFEDTPPVFGCDSGSMPAAQQLAITRRLLTEFFDLYLKGQEQGRWRGVWGPEMLNDPDVITTYDPGVTLVPDIASQGGTPGSTLTFNVTLTNVGNTPTSFTLFPSAQQWATTVVPAQTPLLNPSQTTMVTVQVTVPAGAKSLGSDQLLLNARRDADGYSRGMLLLSSQRVP